MNTRIYNARILTMEEGKPAFFGEVWIEGIPLFMQDQKEKKRISFGIKRLMQRAI